MEILPCSISRSGQFTDTMFAQVPSPLFDFVCHDISLYVIRSEVEMKQVDLVPGDPVGGQIYQFNARIGNLPLPFFFYCTEYVCIKSFSDVSCRWITRYSQKTLFTMPRCPCGGLLSRQIETRVACPFQVQSSLPCGECVFQNGHSGDMCKCRYRRKGQIVVCGYSTSAQRD